ncbi:MAG: AmmeMemoRadiSam system protein A [Candidatus Woesearchaeota archaeon]
MEQVLKETLLRIARQAIRDEFAGRDTDLIALQSYDLKKGVFVTLKKAGELRGCIGYPLPVMKLSEALVLAARSAAFKDPRFPPLKKEELPFIKIEISVLTVPEIIKVKNPLAYPEKIEIGIHGLLIEKGHNSGLLLPQVAVEQEASPQEFLMMLCQKAGLPANAWKSSDVKIYSFEAEIIGED